MADFTISLSTNSADAVWGESAKLSFNESGAVIHLPDDKLNERLIQQAARKLDGLNLPSVTLVGDWHKEQQWAFALSFTRARKPASIKWAETNDKAALEQEYAALLFTRQLVNDTPEDLSPETLATRAAQWIKSLGGDNVTYSMTVGEELKEQGWIGIYNVGRGSERPPAMLVLDYNPTGKEDAPVDAVLVGRALRSIVAVTALSLAKVC